MGNNGSGTLVLPNDIFFSHVSESLAEGKTVTFIVKGCSMYPFFRNSKDRVCMAGYDGRELRKGEVILFRYRGKYVMHRIYGVETDPGGTTVYRTVGDGNVRGRETAVPCEIAGVALKFEIPDIIEAKGYSKQADSILNAQKLINLGWIAKYPLSEGLLNSFEIKKGILC